MSSFNLNKLVQPECGGPNPLVTAARQITTRPSSSAVGSQLQRPTSNVNFTHEFLAQNPTTSIIGNTSVAGPQLSQVQASFSRMQIANNPIGNQSNMMYHNTTPLQFNPQVIPHSAPSTSAAEQLETKYRDDMISQSKDATKADDTPFWQNLAQKYVGLATVDSEMSHWQSLAQKYLDTATVDSEVKEMEAEQRVVQDDTEMKESTGLMESIIAPESVPLIETYRDLSPMSEKYTFDEKNPLIDQFEDPFAEGLKKLEQGDIPSAALLFEAAVQKEPENALAWRYLGTTQAQNEKDKSAIKALAKCLELDKNDQQARLAVAISLANESYQNHSCKYLLEWLTNHEKYRFISASLEEYNSLQANLDDDSFYIDAVSDKRYEYVCEKFLQAARLSPNDPDHEVQTGLGVLFNIRGEYDKAVDCFQAALSVRPEDSLLWNRLGATLANGNKSHEAVIAYKKALELAPGFLRSRYNLAISLIHLNTYSEAAKQLVQILNVQAAGKGTKNSYVETKTITSTGIWNTLRTVATLLNSPELYPHIDGRDLEQCNRLILGTSRNN